MSEALPLGVAVLLLRILFLEAAPSFSLAHDDSIEISLTNFLCRWRVEVCCSSSLEESVASVSVTVILTSLG